MLAKVCFLPYKSKKPKKMHKKKPRFREAYLKTIMKNFILRRPRL
jgi:hypothetical protein